MLFSISPSLALLALEGTEFPSDLLVDTPTTPLTMSPSRTAVLRTPRTVGANSVGRAVPPRFTDAQLIIGVRIKTVYGATGSVKDVTYKDITLSGISDYGIVIEQDYKNGSPTGTPTSGVPITGLTLSNVKGTVDSSATDIYVLCASGACSDWTWSSVNVSGGKASSKCKNVPSSASC
jgi:Glycosyl hydrolases family 28.